METILQIVKESGGWKHSLSLRIENPPYMPLVIEALDESGPMGLQAISVAHWNEENGQQLRHPEMQFEISRKLFSKPSLNPYCLRNDFTGLEESSRFITEHQYAFLFRLHHEHEEFAHRWDAQLRTQGFIEAFKRQQQLAHA